MMWVDPRVILFLATLDRIENDSIKYFYSI